MFWAASPTAFTANMAHNFSNNKKGCHPERRSPRRPESKDLRIRLLTFALSVGDQP
jgi:hypothetical protein